jgi:hypothetical protein
MRPQAASPWPAQSEQAEPQTPLQKQQILQRLLLPRETHVLRDFSTVDSPIFLFRNHHADTPLRKVKSRGSSREVEPDKNYRGWNVR